MGGQKAEPPGVEISTLTPGTGLMVAENGSDEAYIYLGLANDSNNALIIRDVLYGNAKRMASSNSQLDYDGTELDEWLSDTFISYLDSKVQDALALYPLTYTYNNNSDTKTINRKVFCMNVYLARTTFVQSFRTYYGISTNMALVGKNSGGTNKPWWYCSQEGSNYYRVQYTDGNLNGWPASNSTAVWVRPCISVKASAKVVEDNGVYYLRG